MFIEIEKNIASIDKLFSYIQEYCNKYQLNDSISFPVKLAVEEIFTNCIKYGSDQNSLFSLSLNYENSRLTVIISDPGQKFDPISRPEVDTSAPLNKRKVGGLGIHLVKHMIDEIDYCFKDGTNIITLIKYTEKNNV